MTKPAGVSEYLVQLVTDDRAALLEYAVARGHGVEVAEFADSDLLDDAAELAARVAWYQERLPAVTGMISLHGARHEMLPGARDSRIREATRSRVVQCLDLAEQLGARAVVFHCDSDLIPSPGRVAAWAERAAAFWREVMAGRSLELLLENAREPDPRLPRALGEAIGLPQVGLCFDVGHASLMSAMWARATGKTRWPSPADWLEALGAQVRYLHLSDNDGTWDQHRAAGQGTIGWAALLNALARHAPLPAVIEVAGRAGTEETERYLAARAGGTRPSQK